MIEELNSLEKKTLTNFYTLIDDNIGQIIETEAKNVIREAKKDTIILSALKQFENKPLEEIIYNRYRASVQTDDLYDRVEAELNDIADQADETYKQLGSDHERLNVALALAFFINNFENYYYRMIDKERVYKIPATLVRDTLLVLAGAETVTTSNTLYRTLERVNNVTIPNTIESVVKDIYGRTIIDDQPSFGILYTTSSFVDLLPYDVTYRWIHVTEPDRAFPPHEELAGRKFTTANANTVLANYNNDGLGLVYFPGDHNGCRCRLELVRNYL